jgi:alpha-beta hydrolase superfamily lysophospholipase
MRTALRQFFRGYLWLILMVPGLMACTPRVQDFGPDVASPRLTADAFITRDGKQLPLAHWHPDGPPRAVVVALHGFNMYRNYFDSLGPWLAQRGIVTYAYDQRGFGGSPDAGIWGGNAAMAADANDIVALVKQRHPDIPLHLMGVSMGAAVAIVAMTADKPPPIDSAILVAPAVWGGNAMPRSARFGIWLAAHTMPWNRATGSGLRIRPTDNIAILRALGADPLVIKSTRIDAVYGVTSLMDQAYAAAADLRAPVLVLYGDKDEIVPAAPVRGMVSALRASYRLALYRDGWHMLLHDLQAKRVWADIAAWIDGRRDDLPSGAGVELTAWQSR